MSEEDSAAPISSISDQSKLADSTSSSVSGKVPDPNDGDPDKCMMLPPEVVRARITAFTMLVQSPKLSPAFQCGMSWWSLTQAPSRSRFYDSLTKKSDHATSLAQQLGCSEEDISCAFGTKHWKNKPENYLHHIRTRKFYNGNFITVTLPYDQSSNLTPCARTIVTKKYRSNAQSRLLLAIKNVSKTTDDVVAAFFARAALNPNMYFATKLNKKKNQMRGDCETKISENERKVGNKMASEVNENVVNVHESIPASKKMLEGFNGATISTYKTAPGGDEVVVEMGAKETTTGMMKEIGAKTKENIAINKRRSVSESEKVSGNTEIVHKKLKAKDIIMQLQATTDVLSDVVFKMSRVPQVLQRGMTHLTHELLQLIGPKKPGESFSTWSRKGGQKTYFVRLLKPRFVELKSGRQQRRRNETINNFANSVADGENSKCENSKWVRVKTKYKRTKYNHVLSSPEQRLELQLAGNLSDKAYLNFARKLKEMSGFVIHDSKTSMTSMMEGKLPNFTIGDVNVYEKNKLVQRTLFQVDNILDTISGSAFNLISRGLFIETSLFTSIADDVIMLRFAGDKGGSFMKFKFGVTLMNQPFPNSPDSLDLLAVLDTEDSFYNLKHGIFSQIKDELDILFDTETSLFLTIFENETKVVGVCFSYGSLETTFANVTLIDIGENNVSETKNRILLMGNNEINFVGIVQSGKLVGVGSLRGNEIPGLETVIMLREEVSVTKIGSIKVTQKKVRSTLSGDIEFLCNVLGHQGCSSSFPCYLCLTKLSNLRTDRNGELCELRTIEQMDRQASIVEAAESVKKMKDLARSNNSIIGKRLFKVSLSQVVLPILHIILGVTKKLFDVLVEEIQELDGTESNSVAIKELLMILQDYSKYLQDEDKRLETELKNAVQDKKTSLDEYHSVLQDRGCQEQDIVAQEHFKVFLQSCDAEKEIKSKLADFRKTKKKSYAGTKQVITEIKSFQKKAMGKGESLVEKMIAEPPIICKHNPYYSGSFNGSDCLRLAENMDQLLCELLTKYTEEENNVSNATMNSIVDRHKEIWAAWKNVLPSIRAARKLSDDEKTQLIADIKAFYNAYTTHSKGSVTIKIHLLLAHMSHMLDLYGTVGIFAEDSIESIHHIVNTYSRIYAMTPAKKRIENVYKRLEARKHCAGKQAVDKKVKRAKRKLSSVEVINNEQVSIKRKRQGANRRGLHKVSAGRDEEVNASELENDFHCVIQNDIMVRIVDEDGQMVTKKWEECDDEERNKKFDEFDNSELKTCKYCKDLRTEMKIPSFLLPIHAYVCHYAIGEKNTLVAE